MYLEKFKLDGRTALVTGGGRAIGLACVEALAEAGAKVDHRRLSMRRSPRKVATAMQAKGYDVEIVMMDVTKPDAGDEVADDVVKRHGKIDILVNNAGIARSETPAETVTDEHWLNVIDVNLNGTFWCCRAFGAPHARRRSRAPSSISARCPASSSTSRRSRAYYNASKAAVHHLTKSLAAEWGARGVRVNAVAPTYIDTPLNAFVKSKPDMYEAWIGGTPMARLGEVEEIASVVLFLASDAASLMTGSIVLADGGYTCW